MEKKKVKWGTQDFEPVYDDNGKLLGGFIIGLDPVDDSNKSNIVRVTQNGKEKA